LVLLVLVSFAVLGERAAWAGPAFGSEVEPNGTAATATPIAGTSAVIKANLVPNGDLDYYSFTAAAGDRVYAAVQTSFSASASTDSILELFASDGTTLLEGDEDDGSFGSLSSSIANVPIPTAGTYFLRVKHNSATVQLRPYYLHFQLRSGSPTPETESNDTFPGQVLPAGGWVSGSTSSTADLDFFSVSLNAGDTVYLSLDLDPERNGDWNGQLGLGTFDGFVLLVNDSGAGFAPYTAPDSEAYFMTVKTAGSYSVFVGVPTGATPGTYTLSVSVYPSVNEGVNCTTYTSTDVPKAIPDGGGSVSSVITVPGSPRIADINVTLNGNHAFMQDLDFHLISPSGNDNGLITDVFNNATGGPTNLDVTLDDEAAIPPSFTVSAGMVHQPELNYRLSWLDGENAGGTWTLVIRDDFAADTGTLTGWSLTICEPPPQPACAPGFAPTTVFTTDFEGGAAGFTHSGTQDEWELGLPATVATTTANPVAAFNSCNSGTSCWKTDLDNTYNASSNQDLLSAAINLAGFSAPVVVRWAHRYQMDTATNDHYNVSIRQAGLPATAVRLFDFLDATMTDAVGTPVVNIGASAGWGLNQARADAFAGQNTELVFHLDSGTGVTNFGGAAIDDVSVIACGALTADLSITKTDGVATAVPGSSVVYTITASNAGSSPVTGGTVADTFPAVLSCTWTCVGAGGGTCTASGSGNISDTVNLPVGGSVTYTATCTIAASATGTLSNTATVSSAVTDPVPGNNSATDTDTLTPQADLGVTKTDGVTTATPGGSVTYTITASNPGPSNAPGSSVADTFPASLTCTWTCVGAGGGTCTASGSGNISDTVNLPAGGSVTYTASCTISPSATGTLSNTATVAAPGGVTDPTPGNNSATDTDTLGAQADLAITKTDGVTTATPGGSVTYTIVASNAGPSAATGASVTDTFPASLTCTWTCVGAGGGTCTASGSGNISDTVNLPSGGSVTYTASCTISPSATGTLSNTATVAAPGGVTDPTPGNNSATDTDTLGAQADLAITKTDGVTTATPGGSVTYTIVASNAGPSAATGASVADTFPASLTCTWTCVGAGGGTCTASGSGNISDTVNLPAGGSVTYTASCTISPSATGTLSNTATVAAPGGVTDPNPGNNSATDTDTLGAQADLAITKTDGVTTVTAGGSVTYTIVASNAGPSAATGASVTDTFPASLTCTWTCVGSGGGTCTASGSGNIGDTVNLPAGGSVTYTASCTLSPSASGTLSNTATVAAPGGVTDPTPANNSATDTDTISAAPTGASVSGTKTASGTFTVGSTIVYTVILTNNGSGVQADNPGNEFTDVLPATLALVSASATSGTAVANTGTNTVTWNGSLAAGGGSVTITINATILPSAAGTTVSNQGTISYDADGNGTNEATAQTDDPGAPGTANPTSVQVGGQSAAEIPTLSPVGLLVLVMAMAGLALALLRRRREMR